MTLYTVKLTKSDDLYDDSEEIRQMTAEEILLFISNEQRKHPDTHIIDFQSNTELVIECYNTWRE